MFPFANVHTHRPDHAARRTAATALRADQHLPARRGDLLGERVLGEGGLAVAHRPRRPRRPAGLAVHAQLSHLEPSARQAPATAHVARALPAARSNPLDSAPIQRALFIALDEWVDDGQAAARAACRGCATARWCRRCRNRAWASRSIPGRRPYTGLKTTRYLFDYGLDFYETGIATINPPVPDHARRSYQDNPAQRPDLSELHAEDRLRRQRHRRRAPARVTVPLATYTGWALRAGAQANDGCEGSGQYDRVPDDRGRPRSRRATRVRRSRSAIRPSRPTTRKVARRSTTWSRSGCYCARTRSRS